MKGCEMIPVNFSASAYLFHKAQMKEQYCEPEIIAINKSRIWFTQFMLTSM